MSSRTLASRLRDVLPNRRLLLVLFFVLLAAACGTDEGSEPSPGSVRPFAEVQVGEFVFEADPSGVVRGIFRVTTTEPMICSITWGETEALGNLNNDLAMNGTGIIDHNVLLPGAVPGETYFFQVQGSTADGQLFQSALASFTLPMLEAAAATPDREGVVHGANLALSATVVDVSSEFGSAWAATNAIDGDLGTEWSSAGDGDESYVTIDLGSAQEVTGVEFVTRTMADGSATTETFFLIVDGGDRLGPFKAGRPMDPGFNAASFTGRVLRFEVSSSTGGNTGAIEIRVFAAAPG